MHRLQAASEEIQVKRPPTKKAVLQRIAVALEAIANELRTLNQWQGSVSNARFRIEGRPRK